MTAAQVPNGRQQFFDMNGAPLALGSVGMYIPGTHTPKDTWQDRNQAALNANPIPLDAGGWATIWGTGLYRQILLDVLGNEIWDKVVASGGGAVSQTAATVADLRAMSTAGFANNDLVYLLGYATTDDGGQGWFRATTISPGSDNGGTIFHSSTPGWYYERQYGGAALLDWFGAKGDGASDDTAAIQSAFNAGLSLEATGTATYIVSFTGTLTTLGIATRYCIKIPAATTFDGNNCTFKLSNGSNAAMFILAGGDAATTTNVNIGGFRLNGNRSNQTYPASGPMPCLYLVNWTDLYVSDIGSSEARDYFGRFLIGTRGRFENLHGVGSDGQGWTFGEGTLALDRSLSQIFFDDIYSELCNGTTPSGVLPGNGFTCVVKNSAGGKILSKNCAAGHKIDSITSGLTLASSVFIGGNLGTDNSGTKIQGADATGRPNFVSIGEVYSQGAHSTGLFIEKSDDCSVGSYHGSGNGAGGAQTQGDVWLSGKRNRIGSINSVGSQDTSHAVNVRFDSEACHIDTIRIYDCVAVAVNNNSTGLFTYGTVDAFDDIGAMTYAFRVTSTTAQGGGGFIRAPAPTTSQPRMSMANGTANYRLGPVFMSSDPIDFVVTLAAATSTTVSNGNLQRNFAGGSNYLQPLLTIVPVNAAAVTLNSTPAPAFVDYTTGTGCVLHHAAAAGTEKYRITVAGWAELGAVYA